MPVPPEVIIDTDDSADIGTFTLQLRVVATDAYPPLPFLDYITFDFDIIVEDCLNSLDFDTGA